MTARDYKSAERGAFVYQAFEMDCDAIVAQRARVKVPSAKVVQKILEDVGKAFAKQVRQEWQQKKGAAQQHATARGLIRKRRC